MKNNRSRSLAAFALAMIVSLGSLVGCADPKNGQSNNSKPQSSITQQNQQEKPVKPKEESKNPTQGNKDKADKKGGSKKPGQGNKDKAGKKGDSKKPGKNKKDKAGKNAQNKPAVNKNSEAKKPA